MDDDRVISMLKLFSGAWRQKNTEPDALKFAHPTPRLERSYKPLELKMSGELPVANAAGVGDLAEGG
jgi:hypothetical protein